MWWFFIGGLHVGGGDGVVVGVTIRCCSKGGTKINPGDRAAIINSASRARRVGSVLNQAAQADQAYIQFGQRAAQTINSG